MLASLNSKYAFKENHFKLKQKLCASISVEAAPLKSIHKEELKMSTRTTVWKRKNTRLHMNKENRTNSVSSFVITVELEVVPSLMPRELP